MDTRAPFNDPEWAEPALSDHLERRLAAIEDRLDVIEGSLRTEIARDLQTASEEMRRAVSELGRLLLRDLDRLTRVLGQHRDEIVERLAAPGAAAGPSAEAQAPEPAAAEDQLVDAEPISAAVETAPETPAMTGEDGRWRVPGRRKRRSPRSSEGGDTGGG